MFNLEELPLSAIIAASMVSIVCAIEVGRFFGLRVTGRGGDDVSTLEGAALGLLALMIGFTFAMSMTRFEARRDAVLNEANAIGTTALRARLLPAPHNAEVLGALRDYVNFRLEIARRVSTEAELREAMVHSNEIQETLWRDAMAIAAKDSAMVPTGLFIQSLNDLVDNQAKRLQAVYGRVPNIVLLNLYLVAIVAFVFSGYANGLQKRGVRIPLYVMGMLVCTVILLIQDLDRPNSGFITISQQPMIDAAADIASYVE